MAGMRDDGRDFALKLPGPAPWKVNECGFLRPMPQSFPDHLDAGFVADGCCCACASAAAWANRRRNLYPCSICSLVHCGPGGSLCSCGDVGGLCSIP
jgi:hypothetical protein